MNKKEWLEKGAIIEYLTAVKNVCVSNEEVEASDNLGEIILEIKNGEIPAADVAPVVHGYWKPIYPDIDHQDRAKDYECSVCRRTSSDEVYSRSLDFEFYPYCGAKMDKCSPSMDYLTLLRRENGYGR